MEIRNRKATASEIERKYDDLAWYQWKSRQQARRDALHGIVEELSFTVRRAWKLFSCEGAPCCPNDWLIETGTGEYVVVESWRNLPMSDQLFPGEYLVVVRWPESHRLLGAIATGSPVTAGEVPMSRLAQVPDHWLRCEVLPSETVAPTLEALMAAP